MGPGDLEVGAVANRFRGIRLFSLSPIWYHAVNTHGDSAMIRALRRGRLLFLVALAIVAIPGCSSEEKKARHLRKGEAYLAESRTSEAIIEFRNVLQIDPDDAQAHYQLGLAHLKAGQLKEAYAGLARSLELKKENIDAQLKLAGLMLAGRQAEQARERVQFVLAAEPDNAEAHLLMSSVHAAGKDLAKAIAAAERAAELDRKRIDAHLQLAQLYAADQQVARAEEALKRALDVDEKSVAAHAAYADFFRVLGRAEDAEAQYKRVVELEPGKAGSHILLARFYASQGQPEAAEKALAAAVAADPRNPDAYYALADFQRLQGRGAAAAATLGKVLELEPDDTRALGLLAEQALASGDDGEAAKRVGQILKKNPGHPQGLFLSGRLALARKRYPEAIGDFRSAAQAAPQFAPARYHLALAHFANKDGESGRAALSEALKIDPGYRDARLLLAEISLRGGNYDAALEESGKVLRERPDDYLAHLLAGTAAFGKQDLVTAERHFLELLRIDAKKPDGYHQLGRLALAKKRRPDEASARFEEALARDPDFLPALLELVKGSLSQRSLDKAIARVQHQVGLSPKNAAYRLLLGQLYDRGNRYDLAEAELRKSLELDPSNSGIYVALGTFYARHGKLDKALQEYRAAVEKQPDFLQARMLLGVVYDTRKEYAKAREQYEAILRIDPRFGPAANNLAWIEAEHGGRLDRAAELAQIAAEQMPQDPSVADTLGWIFYKIKLYSRAVTSLEEAREKLGDNPVVRYHLGLAYSKNGQPEQAAAELRQALHLSDTFEGADEARKALAELGSRPGSRQASPPGAGEAKKPRR
jgi:tetratricopeptide (TPR) repeat protein